MTVFQIVCETVHLKPYQKHGILLYSANCEDCPVSHMTVESVKELREYKVLRLM